MTPRYRVAALVDASELVIVDWTGEPGPVAPLHVHHEDDEAWYVVEGELGVRVGDEDVFVPAGGAVLVPRGTPHTYWNARPEPARYVLVMTRRIEALIAALHAGSGPATVADVFREHASEYLGWP